MPVSSLLEEKRKSDQQNPSKLQSLRQISSKINILRIFNERTAEPLIIPILHLVSRLKIQKLPVLYQILLRQKVMLYYCLLGLMKKFR